MEQRTPPLKDLRDVQYVIVPSNNRRRSRKRQDELKALLKEGYRVVRLAAGRRSVHWLLMKFEYIPRQANLHDDEEDDDDAES